MLYLALAGQAGLVIGAYWWETRSHPDGERSSLRRALVWSGIWFGLGLLPTALFGLFEGAHSASAYAAVYLIERALSLDNVFVFAVLIAAFEIPTASQDRVVSRGVLLAFAMRIPAIFVGVALFDASHVVGYVLGGLLLVLAWHTARSGGSEESSGGSGRIIGALQRRLPVSRSVERGWIVVQDGRRHVTPLFLCLVAIGLADIAFALDSIPAALAISHESAVLLSANLLALLGLRPLYQLVEVARERLLYMNETIAVLLLFVGLKLLTEDLVQVGPLGSLLGVLVVVTVGTVLSLRADRAGGSGRSGGSAARPGSSAGA